MTLNTYQTMDDISVGRTGVSYRSSVQYPTEYVIAHGGGREYNVLLPEDDWSLYSSHSVIDQLTIMSGDISNGGDMVAYVASNIHVRDIVTDELLLFDDLGTGVSSLWSTSFSPSGGLLAVGDGSYNVYVLSTQSWGLLHEVSVEGIEDPSDTGPIRDVPFSPSGDIMVAAGQDVLKVYDTHDFDETEDLSGVVSDDIRSAGYSPDGDYIAVGESIGTGGLKLINSSDWSVELTIYEDRSDVTQRFIHDVDFNPDGELIAFTNGDGDVYIYTIPDGDKVTELYESGSSGYGVSFSPDGEYLAASGEDSIHIYSTETFELELKVDVDIDDPMRALEFSSYFDSRIFR